VKLGAISLAAAIAGFVTPATAHAFLERANPAAGESLHQGAVKVELHFSEALEPSFSKVSVTDAGGHDMAAGDIDVSGTEMDVQLKKLSPGRYRVSWHAVSVDTHRTEGKYNFLILP
jgi:methionine-rich copper-binding protein CopC